MLVECLRDVQVLHVVGGAVYPGYGGATTPPSQAGRENWFLNSHGISNPTYFWRIISKHDGTMQAYWIPNEAGATAAKFKNGDYVVSLADLELKLAAWGVPETFQVSSGVDKSAVDEVWRAQDGCNRG